MTCVNGLRQRLAAAAGPTAQLPWLMFAGAVMTGAFGMLFASTDVAGGIDKADICPTTAAGFHHLGDAFFVCAELAAVLVLATVRSWPGEPASCRAGGPPSASSSSSCSSSARSGGSA